jgi:hypothetical protein
LVEVGLRHWFEMNLCSPLHSRGGLPVVPSVLVHAAWQQFMRDPISYSAFCAAAIGYDLVGVPAIDITPYGVPAQARALQKAYELALLVERSPARERIPLIFRVDFEAGLKTAVWWTWCDAPPDDPLCGADMGQVCAHHVLHPNAH